MNVEELCLVGVFLPATRQEAIAELTEQLPYIKDQTLKRQMTSTRDHLLLMTDQGFSDLCALMDYDDDDLIIEGDF